MGEIIPFPAKIIPFPVSKTSQEVKIVQQEETFRDLITILCKCSNVSQMISVSELVGWIFGSPWKN